MSKSQKEAHKRVVKYLTPLFNQLGLDKRKNFKPRKVWSWQRKTI